MTHLDPKNIIVRMPNWIGDFVMATPILSLLRKHYPKAKITAMSKIFLCDLLHKDPEVDEVFCFQKPLRSLLPRKENRDLIEKLREGDYDLGILLPNSISSAYLFWQGHVKNRLGFSTIFRRVLLNIPVPRPKNEQKMHLVEVYKHLLKPLGIKKTDIGPRLFLDENDIQNVNTLLEQRGYIEGKKIITIHPGAAYGLAKCWLPERFKEVAKSLLEDENIFVVFVGDASTKDLIKHICLDLPSRAINLCSLLTLSELACLLKKTDLLLTNDSGPMHMADALKTKVVALFGSTNEKRTGPYHGGSVITKKVHCSPCYKRVCPKDFFCMKKITTDEVLEEVRKKLKENV